MALEAFSCPSDGFMHVWSRSLMGKELCVSLGTCMKMWKGCAAPDLSPKMPLKRPLRHRKSLLFNCTAECECGASRLASRAREPCGRRLVNTGSQATSFLGESSREVRYFINLPVYISFFHLHRDSFVHSHRLCILVAGLRAPGSYTDLQRELSANQAAAAAAPLRQTEQPCQSPTQSARSGKPRTRVGGAGGRRLNMVLSKGTWSTGPEQ